MLLGSLALLVGCPQHAGAFGFEKNATRWDRKRKQSIEFMVNMAHVPATFPQEQYVAFLGKALEPWKQIATAQLPFTIGKIVNDETKTEAQEDGVNMIFWQPGFIPRDMLAGKAYPFESECDILLAPRPPFTLTEIQAIVMHELGHCLGLAHSTAPGVMTKFTGLPNLGYDDHVAVSLLYPNHQAALDETTATIKGRIVRDNGDPVLGAVLWILDGKTQRILLGGFSGLVDAQRRIDASGRFELPGIPAGRHRLQVQPMDTFAGADPAGYGSPVETPPEPFGRLSIDLPELEAGDVYNVGNLTLQDD